MNNIEIERKFLVKGDFYPEVIRKEKIVQAYLAAGLERTVRIRIKGKNAFLTIKGAANENGFSRLEFEYPVPLADAQAMLELALPGFIEKERHYVPFENHLFEVDVFHGTNEGLVIAELELQSESESFEKPDWLGGEVTGDEQYYNAYLATNALHQGSE
jgi:CYTH domain-containing protein